MSFLVTLNSCGDPALAGVLLVVKNALSLIQIIVPILLLATGIYHIALLVKDPDDKKKLAKVKNSFLAAVIVFMVPVLVNTVMGILDDSFVLSDCWNNASSSNNNSGYIDPYESEPKTPVYTAPDEYESK